jgi:hypothetical protein
MDHANESNQTPEEEKNIEKHIQKILNDQSSQQKNQSEFLQKYPHIKKYIEEHFEKIQDCSEFALFQKGITEPLKHKIEHIIQSEENALNEYREAVQNEGGSDNEDEYNDVQDPIAEELDEEDVIFEEEELNKTLNDAYELESDGELKKAKILFEQLLQKEPENIGLWNRMTEFYLQFFPDDIFDFFR